MSKRNFTQIENDFLNNPELSLQEKALCIYIKSKPNNWNFSADRIAKDNNNCKNSISTMLKNLVHKKVLIRVKHNTGEVNYKMSSKTQNMVSGNEFQNPKVGITGSGIQNELQNTELGFWNTPVSSKTQNSQRPESGFYSNTIKESNTIDNNTPPIIPQNTLPADYRKWSEQDFKNEVWKLKDKYTIAELNNFFGYWTEKSPTGKMRFQKEGTWSTSRRIANAKRMKVLGSEKIELPKGMPKLAYERGITIQEWNTMEEGERNAIIALSKPENKSA